MENQNHYLDINNKYRIETNKYGVDQLNKLDYKVKLYIGNMELTDEKIAEGKKIYEKKSFKGNETWTDEDYKKKEFIYWYLKVKAKQRYTEIYSLFEKIRFDKDKRIVSIGGGPGFELEALKNLGFKNLINLDKGPWKDISDFFETEYYYFDIFKSDISIYKPNVIILSYVFSNYINNIKGLEIIKKWLEIADYVVINDRKRNIKLFDGMENVYRVMSHNDDRQVIISKQFRLYNQEYNLTFQNIPYKFNQNNGNILHAHFSGYVRYNTLLNYIDQNKNKFYLEIDKKTKYIIHYVSKESKYKTPNIFDTNLIRDYICLLWKSTTDVHEITNLGGLFYFVIKNIDFMPIYIRMIHEQMDNEGIKKCELRLKLGTYFESKGRVSIEEELKKLYSLSKNRIKIIAQSSKNIDTHKTVKYFSLIKKVILKNKLTNFVIAFDLVGDENLSQPLSNHTTLFNLYYFLLHAGEGLHPIHCDNLDFVVKNKLSERIGHGIAILKKIDLLDKIKQNNVCLELTPIGYLITNQLTVDELKKVLNLIIKHKIKCVISPDDVNKYFDSDIEENYKLVRQLGISSFHISSFINFSFSQSY